MNIFNWGKKTIINTQKEVDKSMATSNETLDLGPAIVIISACPYCGVMLEKRPSKKMKCKDCGNFIYVRTRPSDNMQVLVTETQAEQIDEQWSIVNGTHQQYLDSKREFKEKKEELREKFGSTPSDNEVKWRMLNQEGLDHAKNLDWGLYRNTRFEMAEILRKEGRLEAALSKYLEVCYLDLNGPNNNAGMKRESFTLSQGFFAPGVFDRATKIIQKLGLDKEKTQKVFLEMAELNFKGLKLPIAPEEAWIKIEKELFKKLLSLV